MSSSSVRFRGVFASRHLAAAGRCSRAPAERAKSPRVRTDMEVSASACSRFLIDSLLSLGPPAALLAGVDLPELSPAGGSGYSAPPSPQTVRGVRQESAGPAAQPRAASGASFLIRDILGECPPYSDQGQVCPHRGPPGPFLSAPEDFQDKSPSSASSDCESRGESPKILSPRSLDMQK